MAQQEARGMLQAMVFHFAARATYSLGGLKLPHTGKAFKNKNYYLVGPRSSTCKTHDFSYNCLLADDVELGQAISCRCRLYYLQKPGFFYQ